LAPGILTKKFSLGYGWSLGKVILNGEIIYVEMLISVMRKFLHKPQGDQIGRIFAHLAIVTLGSFFENCSSSTNFWPIFPREKVMYEIWQTNGLGFNLGGLFASSSGHPDKPFGIWKLLRMLLWNCSRGGSIEETETSSELLCMQASSVLHVTYKPN
jgi:hypothetical protein